MNVRSALSAVLIASLLCSPAAPATPPPHHPLPGYGDFGSISARAAAMNRPGLCTVRSLAKTAGGRDVWLLTLGRGDVDRKPAVLIVGNTHAPLLLGPELALRIAADLLKDDAATQQLLDRCTFYVIPCPDPDATAAMFERPIAQRTTDLRPTDDDHDGKPDEDGPDDLNGDGLITMMRIEDPAGRWIPHPDDPRVMIEADPARGERGRYKLLIEGLDNDHDGSFNEDGAGGVAFDRNFPFRYPFFDPEAGPYPLSEPQSFAVAKFVAERVNIAAVFSFSVEDNLEHPWKPDGQAAREKIRTTVLGDDAPYLSHLAEAYRKIHPAKGAPTSPRGSGSFVEWCYFHMGRWSVAARGWWPAEVDGGRPITEQRGADQVKALRWMEREKLDGFVAWSAVEHPDFPNQRVEVGGFKPLVRLNPPAKDLDGLGAEHARFVRALAESLPRISIDAVKVEPLGAGVYRVTATVTNSGYLPTVSAMGRITQGPQPLQIAAELPAGGTLIRGPLRQRLGPIPGSGGTAEATWLLRTDAAELKLHAWSPAIGDDTKTVRLK